MNHQESNCPICPKHCAKNALSCEKGKSYFQGEHGNTQHHGYFRGFADRGGHNDRAEGHKTHHGGPHKKFACKVPKNSLLGVLASCGHHVFHCLHDGRNNEDEIFSCLSDVEKEELKELLTKLLVSWEGRH